MSIKYTLVCLSFPFLLITGCSDSQTTICDDIHKLMPQESELAYKGCFALSYEEAYSMRKELLKLEEMYK